MRLVLLGPPGAGKGTQAHRLADRYQLTLIATGDIFRSHVAHNTELGQEARQYMDAGELVPDDVVVRMVTGALAEAGRGFILDGFPRTRPQAEALDRVLEDLAAPISAVLVFEVDDETTVKRLAGRRTCKRCQRTYNVEFNPPRQEGVCDVCGGDLGQRTDDEEATVRHRLELYHDVSQALTTFYGQRGLVRVVDADGTQDEVTERAVAALSDLAPAAGS